jgi:UDP-glucose 4-epimerase
MKKRPSLLGGILIEVIIIIDDLSNSNKECAILSLRYFNPIGAHKSGAKAINSFTLFSF